MYTSVIDLQSLKIHLLNRIQIFIEMTNVTNIYNLKNNSSLIQINSFRSPLSNRGRRHYCLLYFLAVFRFLNWRE
jgi:hypothetical protein